MEKETLKVVFLFSGQGSQYRGMGQKLFADNGVFRASMEESDAIVRQYLGKSIIQQLYDTTEPVFDDLLMTHPAILATEIAMCRVMESMGIAADYVMGTSLGEFAAGVANGLWSAEEALRSAMDQAIMIVERRIEGGMLAVLAPRDHRHRTAYENHGLDLASDNFDGHFTVSGKAADLGAFQKEMESIGTTFLRLPVKAPFHSPLLGDTIDEFSDRPFNHRTVPEPVPGFVSGLHCEELGEVPRDYFWKVVALYTDFRKAVAFFEKKGPCLYIDLGPSGTHATFVKYNLADNARSMTMPVMSPYRREPQQIEKLLEWRSTLCAS